MPKLRDTLAKARELGAPPDIAHAIRNEMANLLTAPDVTVDREWDVEALAGTTWTDYDPVSDRVAFASADRSRVTVAPLDGRMSRTVTGTEVWFCPDGRKVPSIASGPNPDRRVTCWDLDSSPVRALWERTGVADVAFSPDGRLAMVSVAADRTGDTVVLDTGTGREVRRFASSALCYGFPIHPTRPWAALYRDDHLHRVVDYLTGDDVWRCGRGDSRLASMRAGTRPARSWRQRTRASAFIWWT
jgi:WD40 repeat protein